MLFGQGSTLWPQCQMQASSCSFWRMSMLSVWMHCQCSVLIFFGAITSWLCQVVLGTLWGCPAGGNTKKKCGMWQGGWAIVLYQVFSLFHIFSIFKYICGSCKNPWMKGFTYSGPTGIDLPDMHERCLSRKWEMWTLVKGLWKIYVIINLQYICTTWIHILNFGKCNRYGTGKADERFMKDLGTGSILVVW